MSRKRRREACDESWIGGLAGAVGKGLLAGLVGTAAISLSQAIEMKMTGRSPSSTPRQAAEKLFAITPNNEQAAARVNNLTHYGYGSALGTIRGLLAVLGLRGTPANALHIAAVQTLAMVIVPRLGLAPPARQWGSKVIATEVVHHAVYGMAAGCALDWMNRCKRG